METLIHLHQTMSSIRNKVKKEYILPIKSDTNNFFLKRISNLEK